MANVKLEEKKESLLLPLNLQMFASENKPDVNDDIDDDVDDIDDEGDEGNEGDQTDNSGEGNRESKKPEGKTFTDTQLQRMMAKEKNQGRNAVLRELGINPKDKKAVAQVKALLTTLNGNDNSEGNSESEARIQEAELKATKAIIKAEALGIDAKKEFVDDIVVLALAKADEDTDDFGEILSEIKTKYKSFFGEVETDEEEDKKGAAGKKGTGSSMNVAKEKTGSKKNQGKLGLGARLAQSKVQKPKTSHWG